MSEWKVDEHGKRYRMVSGLKEYEAIICTSYGDIPESQACVDGQGNVMRAWDSISQVADYCSGQAHGRREKPGYVISMGKMWETLATEAIDNF